MELLSEPRLKELLIFRWGPMTLPPAPLGGERWSPTGAAPGWVRGPAAWDKAQEEERG